MLHPFALPPDPKAHPLSCLIHAEVSQRRNEQHCLAANSLAGRRSLWCFMMNAHYESSHLEPWATLPVRIGLAGTRLLSRLLTESPQGVIQCTHRLWEVRSHRSVYSLRNTHLLQPGCQIELICIRFGEFTLKFSAFWRRFYPKTLNNNDNDFKSNSSLRILFSSSL